MAEQAGVIGKGIRVRGEITGEGGLEVEGEVEGKVELDRLTVGASGFVNAEVSVSEAVISGRSSGHVSAKKRVEVRGSALVEGDLTAPALTVEEGAVVKGRVHMDTGIPEDL